MNSRYLIRRSLTTYPVPIVARKREKSGKSTFVKKSSRELKKMYANSVSFSKKPLRKLKKKILNKVPSRIHSLDITSSIISTEPIMDISQTTPPTKAVGDQHRPHLNTLLEERSHLCLYIYSRLKLMLSTKLKSSLMNTWLRFSKISLNRNYRCQ